MKKCLDDLLSAEDFLQEMSRRWDYIINTLDHVEIPSKFEEGHIQMFDLDSACEYLQVYDSKVASRATTILKTVKMESKFSEDIIGDIITNYCGLDYEKHLNNRF